MTAMKHILNTYKKALICYYQRITYEREFTIKSGQGLPSVK